MNKSPKDVPEQGSLERVVMRRQIVYVQGCEAITPAKWYKPAMRCQHAAIAGTRFCKKHAPLPPHNGKLSDATESGCIKSMEDDSIYANDLLRTEQARSLQRMVRPIPDALTMRDIVSDFVKANGWEDLVTTLPGTAQVKMLYKSPLTGNYHSLSFALGMILDSHGIPAA